MIKFDRANARMRPMAAEDKCLVLSWRNTDRVRQHMYTTHIITKAEHDAWYANVLDSDDKNYFIFQLKDRPFGVISFSEINHSDETAFWAFYLGVADAPVGAGSVMEYLALEYAFHELNLFKLSCEVLATNSGVVKLHNKFGFREEGVFRKHRLREGGRVDVYRLALFKDEWLSRRGEISMRLFGVGSGV